MAEDFFGKFELIENTPDSHLFELVNSHTQRSNSLRNSLLVLGTAAILAGCGDVSNMSAAEIAGYVNVGRPVKTENLRTRKIVVDGGEFGKPITHECKAGSYENLTISGGAELGIDLPTIFSIKVNAQTKKEWGITAEGGQSIELDPPEEGAYVYDVEERVTSYEGTYSAPRGIRGEFAYDAYCEVRIADREHFDIYEEARRAADEDDATPETVVLATDTPTPILTPTMEPTQASEATATLTLSPTHTDTLVPTETPVPTAIIESIKNVYIEEIPVKSDPEMKNYKFIPEKFLDQDLMVELNNTIDGFYDKCMDYKYADEQDKLFNECDINKVDIFSGEVNSESFVKITCTELSDNYICDSMRNLSNINRYVSRIYENKGDYKNAIKLLELNLKISPSDGNSRIALAFIYNNLGDVENTLLNLRLGVKYITMPYQFSVYYFLGERLASQTNNIDLFNEFLLYRNSLYSNWVASDISDFEANLENLYEAN